MSNDRSNNLSVNTDLAASPAPPGLALSSSSTTPSTLTSEPSSSTTPSTFTNEPSPSFATPTDQSITTMTQEQRVDKAKQFVAGLGLNWDGLGQEGQHRAKRLMSEDYSWSPDKDSQGHDETTFRVEFSKFCDSDDGKEWKDCSRVFFDPKAIEEYLVIRKQKAGICCLHAGVVVQHYLRNLRKRSDEKYDHKMLDISEFIREHLPEEKQKKYVKTGACGLGSVEFFRMITGAEDCQLRKIQICKKSTHPGLHDKDLESFWISWNDQPWKGPALVSCFKIEKDFLNRVVFDGEVDRKKFDEYAKSQKRAGVHLMHSMVLLGAYKDENTDKVWFLLQNFWKDKYFRVVSAEYMASCEATICSVPENVDVSLKDSFNVIDAEYAETDVQFEECAPSLPAED